MEQMFELMTRVLCDVRPGRQAEGAYLFAQTRDNQPAVFDSAAQLLAQALTTKILLIETGAKSGYPGFEIWREQLLALNIEETHIQGVTIGPTPTLNTLIESQALVRFAQKRGWTTLYVVAAPFQQVRAFMTTVTVALREYPDLQIYSYAGTALPWLAEVVHSQGTTRATRTKLITGELERIGKYQNKGDLASFEDVLGYLNKRDR